MTCPVCCGKTKIKDSRGYIDYVIRSRKCRSCGFVFRTIETEEDIYRNLNKKEKEQKDGRDKVVR